MEIETKLKILKGIDTKELIANIYRYEGDLETALREDASFKNLNHGYLSSGHGDCQAVKSILAELAALAPDTATVDKTATDTDKKNWLKEQKLDPNFTGTIADAPGEIKVPKSLTEADKKAWLERQRTENQELAGAINKQKEVLFLLDNNQISTDMIKRRLEGTRAILALRTQQIAFLAS